MSRLKLTRTIFSVCGLIVVVCVVSSVYGQSSVSASANWSTKYNSGSITQPAGGGGFYSLGSNTATVGSDSTITALVSNPYSPSSSLPNTAFRSNGKTTSTASSQMIAMQPVVLPPPWSLIFPPWFSHGMSLSATVTRDSIVNKKGSALAVGSDPQFFDTSIFAGVYHETLSWDAGTSVYIEDSSTDEAWISIRKYTSLIPDDILSIQVQAVAGGDVTASVSYTTDPRVQFSIDHQDLEDYIRSPGVAASLTTLAGLAAELSLVSFWFDLNDFAIAPGEVHYVGYDAVSWAQSVPEPGSAMSLLLAVLFGVGRRRSRQSA